MRCYTVLAPGGGPGPGLAAGAAVGWRAFLGLAAGLARDQDTEPSGSRLFTLDGWGVAGIGVAAAVAVLARRGTRTDLKVGAGAVPGSGG
jgi:hypothetical protein